MSLFLCPQCGCVDNTAPAGYWGQKYSDGIQKPLCTECSTGKWHDIFPKQMPQESGHTAVGDDGFLYRPEELKPGGYFHGTVKLREMLPTSRGAGDAE
jgi:hypothetical protein